ncbi:glycosyltransferase [Actinoplanes friuliensis]|uniref:Family 2 glycosyl transferase n=1 Tax=Actinoplanes friuliensis DSM 7358 TaxID=1246995 RepID=U5VX11_9ACTN|nr:glycosyltransferase family 2 protein [Actinoplanes friuliensis]AGZ40255.1 family 2 glycosyl transferase [Actinoplanes friuliensis DSM 7358]
MIWPALLPWVALTGHTIVNAALLRRLSAGQTSAERIAVLLPLRNEAERVTPCLESLLNQRGVRNLEIIVLDDGSTDGTADVVRAAAPGSTVRLLTGAALPPGWLGKPHACAQLADAAADADVLVFLDADVVLAPDAIAGAATLLRKTGVDLLSPYPRIVGAGRLVQPLLQWSWLTFLPLRIMERSPRPSLAAAGGQWLVVDRAGYERAGGHAAVRDDVLEDIGLARAVKRSGGRIALADASGFADCLMYTSWPDLRDGYSKSLWASFGSPAGAAAVVTLLILLYAVPPLAALVLAASHPVLALWSLAAYGIGVVGRVVSARATGGRAWPDALAHPISVLIFGWLVVRSFRLRRRGLLAWRGRPV